MADARRRWRPPASLRISAAIHAVAAAGVLAAPGRWPLAAALVAANHLVLTVAGLMPRSRLLGPNLTRLPPAAARGGQVALTLDDGPDPEVTPRVLAQLERTGATASFFLIGRRAEQHPDLVAEIVRRGHRVENHTYSHANLFAMHGPRAQAADIDRAQRVLTDLSGRAPVYLRPPAGIRSPLLDWIIGHRGLCLTSWTRRGFDTVDSDAVRVAGRLTRRLRAGDVLLLHDGNAARNAAHRPVVLDALPRVLDALAAHGLRAVALPPQPAFPCAAAAD